MVIFKNPHQWQSFVTRFTVAELLEDSDAPAAPEPAVETLGAPAAPESVVEATGAPVAAAAEPVEQQVERYSDGVAVNPTWLGRNDLP
ncbi:hypothetical protein ACWEQ7_10760 [Streptomyces sp. NPDC004069]